MKLKQLLFSAALLASMSAMGQSVPTHEMYVDFGITERTDIVSALDKWQPGDNFSNDPNYQDENFFISRVPLKTRFINSNTQANKNLNEENNKNLCWCSPIGEMTKKWGPMPRYNFDGDNFNMWQYINIHANWSNSWFRVPGTFNDVAHKNGVRTGCLSRRHPQPQRYRPLPFTKAFGERIVFKKRRMRPPKRPTCPPL